MKTGHLFTTELLRRGISANGVQQMLGGEIITGLADRNKIVRVILATKNEDIEVEHDETHFMARTESVGKDESLRLQRAGISATGAQQILNSQPLTNANDRRQLALVIAFCYDKIEW